MCAVRTVHSAHTEYFSELKQKWRCREEKRQNDVFAFAYLSEVMYGFDDYKIVIIMNQNET